MRAIIDVNRSYGGDVPPRYSASIRDASIRDRRKQYLGSVGPYSRIENLASALARNEDVERATHISLRYIMNGNGRLESDDAALRALSEVLREGRSYRARRVKKNNKK